MSDGIPRFWLLDSTAALEEFVDAELRYGLAAALEDTGTQGIGGVHWSENSNADDFSKNPIRARCEGRFNTSVLSPLGVVVADLTP